VKYRQCRDYLIRPKTAIRRPKYSAGGFDRFLGEARTARIPDQELERLKREVWGANCYSRPESATGKGRGNAAATESHQAEDAVLAI
jgi:hypothetical protein